MDFLPEKITKYTLAHTSPESELLSRINRETHAKVLVPQMLSGHLQGRVLSMFSKMINPKRVLEIGTYTGYSAICLAEGLSEDGLLYTIDINEELETVVRGYFEEAGLSDKINYLIGDATALISGLDETFDLVFIDADKTNYSNYFDLIIDKLLPGGFIIADNVLWDGKVTADKGAKIDKDTQAIMDFNNKIHHDLRVENVIFPVRDGLMVVRKS